ncbi:MAG TPA: redox-sensing transcriptional repressor Rex, partial [Chthonomonadales bacterium]|nr:redox-sensing transcriptional repressor Rex [Chthonomonadales bacterium]
MDILANTGAIRVPVPTLERLANYLRFLVDIGKTSIETISSAEVERQTGINAAQFRKDLSYFGEFGKPGVGYNVIDLQDRIAQILKIDREQRVILVGAGNLGSALVGYPGLREHRFNLVAVFDNNYGKIGRPLWNLEILDIERVADVNAALGARIAILAVPAAAAQAVTDQLVAAGIRAILNFAPFLLRVPPYVHVRNVSFLQELAVLSYHLSTDQPMVPGDAATPGQHSSEPRPLRRRNRGGNGAGSETLGQPPIVLEGG